MSDDRADALTLFVLDLFRLNNALLTAGDRLVGGLGLTSARWQILGAIAASPFPRPVAWLARDLGANRQNIQRIVNDLVRDGLAEFQPNPHHRRAQLVLLTPAGIATFTAAMELQRPWIEDLAAPHTAREIADAHRLILSLRQRLAAAPAEAPDAP